MVSLFNWNLSVSQIRGLAWPFILVGLVAQSARFLTLPFLLISFNVRCSVSIFRLFIT